MKTIILVAVALVSVVIAASVSDVSAQTAGSSVISVSKSEMRQVATGWSAKKQILGKDVYNDTGEKIGEINDLIVAPNKSVSYAIVGVGGFLGMGEKDVAVPFSSVRASEKNNKWYLVLNTNKEALKTAPGFTYDKTKTAWVPAAR